MTIGELVNTQACKDMRNLYGGGGGDEGGA